MRFTRMLAGAAALALVALPAAGRAQPMGPMGSMGPMGMHDGPDHGMMGMKVLLRAAHLTPDQRNQVRDIVRGSHQEAQPLMEQLHQLHEQIASKLAGTGSVTLAELTPLQQQVNAVQGQVEQLRLKAALQIRALLTAEQLQRVAATHQKLLTLREEMRDVMGPPDGPDGPEGPGPEAPPPAP